MARLALRVLGALQVSLDGRPIKTFRSAKTRALLVYLMLESDRPHTRDALAGLLWPDQSNLTARNNLRETLALVRKSIGDRTDSRSPWLEVTRNTIQFNPSSDHSIDAIAFAQLLDACATHRHRHSETCRECAANRRQAVELYCGDFLDQFFLGDSVPFEEWALLRRERLRERQLDALSQLAEFHERRGMYKQAHQYALRQLQVDPWREEAHRQAMRALALDGRCAAALAQYESCRRALADGMGVEPDEQTTALYEAIKQQAGLEDKSTLPLLARSPVFSVPSPVTPLLGRETELEQLGRLLSDPDCRMISIVGPGGVGKTRLAIAAAAEQKVEFDDGVVFVSLSSLDSPRLLAPTILSALGVPRQAQRDPMEQLVTYLREREILLLLDSFEHLLEGAPSLAELLRRAPRLSLLVTSRERLNLHGEWVLDLYGLRVPEGGSVEEAERSSAVQLFLQSARRGVVASSFSDEDKAAVVRICHQVEGIPLAIELAAAWVRTLSCREVADEIEKSFGFLTTGLRDVPPRHRSMRAVFEHSWTLLDAEERRALRQLAVFQGGFQREAAERVAGAALPLLSALVDKSLVRSSGAERFSLHDLVKEFAYEELVTAQEMGQTQRRHAEYYLQLVQAAMPQLDGPEQATYVQQLEAEHPNLRAALAWSVKGGPATAEIALRLSGGLARFWDMRGYASEGRGWIELALKQADESRGGEGAAATGEPAVAPIPAIARIKALLGAGGLSVLQGDSLAARTYYQQALGLCQQPDDKVSMATILQNLGNVACHLGEYAEGRAFYERSLTLYRELGNKRGEARGLHNMGFGARLVGDNAAARLSYEEALALRREIGDRHGIAITGGNLGELAIDEGDLARARVLLEESLAIRRELGNDYGAGHCLIWLANVARAEHDDRQMLSYFKEGLALLQKVGDSEGIVSSLEWLASVLAEGSQVEQGVRLWGAAEGIREAIGIPMPLLDRSHQEEAIARARAECDQAAFARAWAEGRAMTLDQAIAFALETLE